MNEILVCYTLGTAEYIGASVYRQSRVYASMAFASGLALNLVALGQRWADGAHVPLASRYDVFMTFAAVMILFSFVVEYRRRIALVGMFAGSFAVLLTGYASTLDTRVQPLVPALRNSLLAAHVGSNLIGYAACAVACAASILYLRMRRTPSVSAPAGQFEELAHGSILFAFPFLTAGMSLGMLRANNAGGSYWNWDPQGAWSLVVWLIYGYYVCMRLLRNRGGVKMAGLSIAGFSAILFTLFGLHHNR